MTVTLSGVRDSGTSICAAETTSDSVMRAEVQHRPSVPRSSRDGTTSSGSAGSPSATTTHVVAAGARCRRLETAAGVGGTLGDGADGACVTTTSRRRRSRPSGSMTVPVMVAADAADATERKAKRERRRDGRPWPAAGGRECASGSFRRLRAVDKDEPRWPGFLTRGSPRRARVFPGPTCSPVTGPDPGPRT